MTCQVLYLKILAEYPPGSSYCIEGYSTDGSILIDKLANIINRSDKQCFPIMINNSGAALPHN